MNDIVELVNLLSKTKLQMNGVWSAVIEPNSKMERLYEAIQQRKVLTDEDAKAYFESINEDAGTLPNIKNKLKERMLDAVFLLDFKDSSFSNRQKAFYECHKKWAAGMILLIRNLKISGIDLLEKLLRHTVRFEFTELTLDILRVLRLQYSTVDGDFKKYQQVREQFRQYESIWMMENKAEDYYADLMSHFTNSKASKTELTDQAVAYYKELEPFMQECEAFKLHLFGRLIHLMVHSIVNNYAATAKLCEEAIAFFDKKDYNSGLPLQVFYYNLIVSYIQLREFDKGQVIIKRSEQFFEEGSFNWFKLQELFFQLSMHTGHYNEAYAIYQKVSEHPRFPAMLPQITEMWTIFQSYLYYLIKIGHISDDAKLSKFRINKFLNEIPLFSKDKAGMNIPILIVQVLHSIADRDYDKSVDRIEGIEKYCTRYLKDKTTYRSNNFIKMMLQIPIAVFQREEVERKAGKYFQNLQKTPLEVANQTHEVEIIPYEALWSLTLETLKK